jgi:hypothetical protein
MVPRNLNRLGVLTGGGLIALATTMPALQAQRPAARQAAPAPADRNDGSVTVTGCLLLGPHGDFTITRSIAVPGSILNSVAWKLEGTRELLGHILEKVEVTGTMLLNPADPAGPGRDGAASYRLRVKTIKKITGDCS